jgi:starch synthase
VTTVEVLSVVPEVFPLVKTGGLGDVAGALPLALAAEDVHTTTLVPGYPAVMAALRDGQAVCHFPELFGGEAHLVAGRVGGLELLAIDAPHLYARSGNPYVGPDGRDWPDNAARFAALSFVAAEVGEGVAPTVTPDIVHAHDWQAGLAPAYLHYRAHGGRRRPGTVMTVHNIAFQGQFSAETMSLLGLPPGAFSVEGVEYYGGVGYLKAGLALADRITTVSPTYAAEIRTPEHGLGLDGLLRTRSGVLSGILNGIDDTVWDPATDKLIPVPFSAPRLTRRSGNKSVLQARLGLAMSHETLLIGVVSRMTWQKGLDLLLAGLSGLLERGAQLAVLGSGDRGMQADFAAAAGAHPSRVGCVLSYDEALAHQIQAGADALLVPSRFEPCGLTQLCALRYGCLPVVGRVGGLADTVIDANEAALAAGTGTGIQFSPITVAELDATFQRVTTLWQQPTVWQRLQRNAMRSDVSWRRPAKHYAALYRGLREQQAG